MASSTTLAQERPRKQPFVSSGLNIHQLSVRLSLQPSGHPLYPLVYLPGDLVVGSLDIYSIGPSRTTDIKLYLTGVTRIWMPSHTLCGKPKRIVHQFLRQTCPVIESASTSPGLGVTRTVAPFRFRIASNLATENCQDGESIAMCLPPSVAQGKRHVDESGILYMQPLISFEVLATVSYQSESELGSVKDIQAHCPIVVASGIDDAPPLYQTHNSGTTNVTCSTLLKSSFLGSPVAKIEVSMDGSDPLRSSSGCHNQHFKRHLWLKWSPAGTSVVQMPKIVTVFAKALLVSTTYYGTRRLEEQECLLDGQNGTESRTESLKLWSRKLQVALPEPTKSAEQAFLPLSVHVLLPIESSKVIPPTFSTPYTLRRDTLRVLIRIRGYRHDTLVLESPTQVNQCFTIRQLGATPLAPERSERSTHVNCSEPPPPYSE